LTFHAQIYTDENPATNPLVGQFTDGELLVAFATSVNNIALQLQKTFNMLFIYTGF